MMDTPLWMLPLFEVFNRTGGTVIIIQKINYAKKKYYLLLDLLLIRFSVLPSLLGACDPIHNVSVSELFALFSLLLFDLWLPFIIIVIRSGIIDALHLPRNRWYVLFFVFL